MIEGEERVAAVVPGIGIVGAKGDSAIAGGEGFLVAVEGVKSVAAVVVGVGVAGVEGDGAVVAGEGFRVLAKGVEDGATVGPGLGRLRVGLEGGVDEFESEGVLAGLVGDDAEQVERYGVVGGGAQDLAAKGFGFSQPAGGVLGESLVEQAVYRCGCGWRRGGFGKARGLAAFVLHRPVSRRAIPSP